LADKVPAISALNALNEPFTSNFACGFVLPIPTSPLLERNNVETLTTLGRTLPA
jgi:hypothetical protein